MTAAAWGPVADALDIRPGTRILDVGGGGGGFCRLAADRGADVSAIDAEAAAVAETRRRAPGADVRVGFMEMLPWADRTFDAVTGFNAFQYALDIELALREARRVLRPGGRLGICKWGRQNELFALAVASGASRPGALWAQDPVDAALRRVGLRVGECGHVPVELRIPDPDALAAATGVVDAATHASPFRRPDGTYRFAAELTYCVAGA